MTWLLTSKTGLNRGESWTIGARPLVLGRSLSCDITIGDPTVSRKHCEVRLDGDIVYFRDLGSRNVSLINGRAVDECRLLVGDELSLGTESFIVTRTSSAVVTPQVETEPKSTTLTLDEAIFFKETAFDLVHAPHHPTTVKDLVRLYHFGRRLSQAQNEAEFASHCLSELENAFPARIKVAVVCQGASGLIWYPPGFNPSDDLRSQVEEAMERGEASLGSFRARRVIFRELLVAGVAPLRVSGRSRGALVIQSAAREYIPEQTELGRLCALAQTASPYLGSLEQRDAQAPDCARFSYGGDIQFIGKSPAVEALREEIRQAASSRDCVLITGEPGTGKELAAHLIHHQSAAGRGPMVSTNCLTLAGHHFHASMTGSERSDGTGGLVETRGLLEQARGGTLLLREITALTPTNQAELQRLLKSMTYQRVGSTREHPVACRIIATTNRDLDEVVRTGEFSADLVMLLGRQRIHINPLRRRPTDIRTLAEHFVSTGHRDGHHRPQGLTEEALAYLQELPLRGNARELRSTLARAARASGSDWLRPQDIQNAVWSTTPEPRAELAPLEKAERTLIQAVLAQCEGNIRVAAEILGIPVSTLERLTGHEEEAHLPQGDQVSAAESSG